MAKQFKNADVTVVRDAQTGDKDYDANKDQVLIRLADGTEMLVLRTDLKDKPAY